MRIKRTWRWMAASLMFLFLGVSFVACSQNGSGDAFEIHTERISFPAVAGSGEPFLAVGPDGSVYASWLENSGEDAHRFQFSRFLPATDSWTEPLTIAEGEDWFVNWADVPSIAIGSGGAMAAHWLARNEQGRYTYGIRVSISGDGGQSWTEPVWLHDDNSASEHGFAALTWLGDGSLSAVWLDGRKYAMGENEMTLRGRTISLNESGSAGITFSDEVLLDERTCDCCPNASLMTEAGTLVSVYRDRTEDEVRDVYAVRMKDGAWSDPVRVASDGWMINACPVNGPAIAASGSNLVVSWFTAAGGTPQVLTAFSTDEGVSFGAPSRLDAGTPTGRVAVVMTDPDHAVVMWIEGGVDEADSGIMVRRIGRDGSISEQKTIARTSSSRASGYPRMVRTGDRLLFLWTQTGDDGRVVSALSDYIGG